MWRDDACLLDMLLASRRAAAHARDARREDFATDRMLQDAVVLCLMLVGEAAARLTLDFRARHRDIQWRRIIGMRNRLIHDYRAVDPGAVWRTVRDDVPDLIARLEALVPPEDDGVAKP